MAKTLGYLITWTTYGTWLQGDERGYVKKGKVYSGSAIPISRIVAKYKTAARIALKKTGLTGRVWTKGYDKRYCFEKSRLADKIKYVNNYDNTYLAI